MSGRSMMFKVFLLTGFILIVISCGPKTIGYGVILWSPDEERILTGETVPVYEDSSIRDVYIVGTKKDGTGEDGETMLEIPRPRLEYFKKEKEASVYAEEYAKYKSLFAKTLKDGLAIRSEPDELSERVYKLRQGQIIKVIKKLEPFVQIGEHEGNWYRVMTEEGISGYCFGYNLEIFDKSEEKTETVVQTGDPKLHAFLNRIYRPEYYKNMLDEGRIDLTRFTQDFGIFPNKENRQIRIVLPETSYTVEYETIEKTGGDRYVFTGSSLEVITLTMNKVFISFKAKNTDISGNFYYIEGIEDIRIAEQERRENLKQMFTELGILKSAAYGVLTFTEKGTFSWKGYDRLVPGVIPENTGTEGTLSFNYFLSQELNREYEGAVTFEFAAPPGTETPPGTEAPPGTEEICEEVCFLYSITNEGLKLVYVPKQDIRNGVIERENPSPIVLFFSS